MLKILCFGLMGAATIVSAQSNTSDGLAPGAWTQTFSMQMTKINGQPAPAVPPETSSETACFTSQDVADPRRVLLAGAEQACSVSNFSMKSGKISMAVNCTFAPDMTVTGELGGTYSPAAFKIKGSLHSQGGATSEVSAAMSATRVGVCQH